jgi:hypothetical protein
MIIEIVLPDHRPPSWNTIYAGVHHSKRKQVADAIHVLVRAYIDPDWPMYSVPVNITVQATFKGKRALDPCNIPAKLYIDGLLGHLLQDDGPKYVFSVTTKSVPSGGDDYVTITIVPAN